MWKYSPAYYSPPDPELAYEQNIAIPQLVFLRRGLVPQQILDALLERSDNPHLLMKAKKQVEKKRSGGEYSQVARYNVN